MTIDSEYLRAIWQTRSFLQRVIRTPRVPREVKEDAFICLKHYPMMIELRDLIKKKSPYLEQLIREAIQSERLNYLQQPLGWNAPRSTLSSTVSRKQSAGATKKS